MEGWKLYARLSVSKTEKMAGLFVSTNPFSSFHKIVERGRRPLDGVNVPLHSVLQRRALSTLQLHVTVTGNKECYDCYNLSVYNTKYLNAAEKLTE